jgi:hypothetical protein
MATTKSPPDVDQPGHPAAAPPTRPPQPSEPPLWTTPIYYGRGRGGRRRRRRNRYTKGTRAWQRLTFGSERATYRLANSWARGLRTFVRRSDRSRRRKKDGLIRDSLRNASRGFSVALRELGRAPGEIAWRIGTRNVRRTVLAFNPGNPFKFLGR